MNDNLIATIPDGTEFAVFDTETTGLFLFREGKNGPPVPADDPRQPRMASFAVVFADASGNEIGRHKAFIRPDGWSVAEYDARAIAQGKKPASEVNGLTDAFLMEHGVPVADVLALWNRLIDQSLIAAAFTPQFDCKMMRAELRRAGLPDRFEETRNVCLMKALDPYGAQGLCIQRGFVKLAEACEFFGIVNADAHDALADAKAAQEILAILIRDDRLPEARVHYAAA